VQGSGFRVYIVQGSGFRVYSAGFRVYRQAMAAPHHAGSVALLVQLGYVGFRVWEVRV
jgi:hypothetical protein